MRGGVVALTVGLAGLVVAAGLALAGLGDFWRAYLAAALACLGLGLGGLALLMIHVLSGGRWGWFVRWPLEGLVALVPLGAALLLPVGLVLGGLYPWVDAPLEEEVLRAKAPWLQPGAFLLRGALYLAVWCALALLVGRGARRRAAGARPAPGLTRLAAGGLCLHVLVTGFAGVDWLASLEPRWYSSIVGLELAAAQALGAWALVVVVACVGVLGAGAAREDGARARLLDLGNLLLMLVAFDAYLAFSQYFIIWNGDLPHHVIWYVRRTEGLWAWVGGAALVLQYGLPLALLLFRAVKREARRLLAVAALVLAGRGVDAVWAVLPSRAGAGAADLVVGLAAACGLGGLFAAAYLWRCRRALEATR